MFAGSNGGTASILLWLVVALLADDVGEGIQLLFGLAYLLLQIGKSRLEVAHLLFLPALLLLVQRAQQMLGHLEVEAVPAAVGCSHRLAVDAGNGRVSGERMPDELGR